MDLKDIETKYLVRDRKHITHVLRSEKEIGDNRLIRLVKKAIMIDQELKNRRNEIH